jgi:antitoxin ParD1/3/4
MAAQAAGRNISLTEQHIKFVDEQVASGRHASPSEVVREALRRYEDDVARDHATAQAIQAMAARGDADYAAGRFTSYETSQARKASMDGMVASALNRHRSSSGTT